MDKSESRFRQGIFHLVLMMVFVFCGCTAHSPVNEEYVSKSIRDRTGHGLSLSSQSKLPEDVSLADGLTDDEAVSIALWNNASFQADLADLGIVRADLVEAGLLRNPILSLLFPVGPKQLEFTVNLPLDLLQRPRRVAAAKLEVERVGENLVQHGLNLVRDVKVAFADLSLAQQRTQLASEEVALRQEIAGIVEARLRSGDISELESDAAKIDASRAEDRKLRFTGEALVARSKLSSLLGFGEDPVEYELIPPSDLAVLNGTLPDLQKEALAARPDLRAAELSIEAAGKRAGWERSKMLNLAVILDANAKGQEGFEMGPGMQAEIPIFNWNNGKIARAEADIVKASRLYTAIRQQIILEVQEAYANFSTAQKTYELWNLQIVPKLAEEITRTEKQFEAGEVSYLAVLEIKRQHLEARMSETEAFNRLHSTAAQVERATGKKKNSDLTGGMQR